MEEGETGEMERAERKDRLIVVADIHGQYSVWRGIVDMLEPGDKLAVAGDLFDTLYGNPDHCDFLPELIRKEMVELSALCNGVYYVYGNCDQTAFYPGHAYHLKFDFLGKKILLRHGHPGSRVHQEASKVSEIDILIEGHTHVKRLERVNDTIHLNPGSASIPRDGGASYAVVDDNGIRLVDLNSRRELVCLSFL